MIKNREVVKRKKILVLTSTFPRWTNDNEPPFVLNLCKHLSAPYEVWVLAPHAPLAKTTECIEGIHVARFRYFFDWGECLAYQGGIMANLRKNRLRYLLVPLFFAFQVFTLRKLLKLHRFDIVHAHWLIPQGLSAVICKRFSVKFPVLVCTSHGSDLHGLRGWFLSAIKCLVIRNSYALTTVSRAMREIALSLGAKPERTPVISMGVDTLRDFTPDPAIGRSTVGLLFVGRLVEQKGLDLLIRAIPHLLVEFPTCRLTVVGEGPAREDLHRLSADLGVDRQIDFVGAVANDRLPGFYQKAAMLICPSVEEEGFGLVCVEALACECPVVATDLPATRETIQDGVTGFLFQRANRVELTQKVLALLRSPETGRAMGMAGRNFVQMNFDWEVITHKYCQLFKCAMEKAT